MEQDWSSIEQDYTENPLDESNVFPDPLSQFLSWFQEILDNDLPEKNAFSLSTVSAKGRPSSRIVLLKGIENRKFIFFTSYTSRKGKEIANNSWVSFSSFWPTKGRQFRAEGKVRRVTVAYLDSYFATRPRISQIAAWASSQSSVIKNRKVLEDRMAAYELKFKGKEVPRPPFWGGFQLTPRYVEFWQARQGRLHDRIAYLPKKKGGWKIQRLSP